MNPLRKNLEQLAQELSEILPDSKAANDHFAKWSEGREPLSYADSMLVRNRAYSIRKSKDAT